LQIHFCHFPACVGLDEVLVEVIRGNIQLMLQDWTSECMVCLELKAFEYFRTPNDREKII
jgi:hypothetical protein